jgi:hypothetical protein
MGFSEQFKSLNSNKKKLRKLCIDEVGGVKMEEIFFLMHFAIQKKYFLDCFFLVAPLA